MFIFNFNVVLSGNSIKKIRKSRTSSREKYLTQKLVSLMSFIKLSEAKFVSNLDFNIQDLQWNLCEFDKYERIRKKEGGRKRRYH